MKTIYKHLNKDEIIALCEHIEMPSEVATCLCDILDTVDFTTINSHYDKLFSVDTGGEAVKEIDMQLETIEKKGFVWLAICLVAALDTKDTYDEMGIDEQIFYDTMAIFTRFVYEHKESFGVYGFDRHWWTYRQLACNLFRIGELEYEITVFSGENAVIAGEIVLCVGDQAISVHIPSDAQLTPELCEISLTSAVAFFETYFSAVSYVMFYCHSWIISPNLKAVLPETSNIIKFLELFEIYRVNLEATGYKTWVFKNDKLSIEEFPQDTSLQRNIEDYLKQGGKLGDAAGIIRKAKYQ